MLPVIVQSLHQQRVQLPLSSAPFPLPRPPLAISVCILPHSIGCRVHVHSDHRRPLSVSVFSAPPGCRVQEHSGQRGASVLQKKYVHILMCPCMHACADMQAYIALHTLHPHYVTFTPTCSQPRGDRADSQPGELRADLAFLLPLFGSSPRLPQLSIAAAVPNTASVAQYIAGCYLYLFI